MNEVSLWFTSATSTSLFGQGGPAAYAGLYSCSLDKDSGKCHSPQTIANGWSRDGRWHHDMQLSNVMIDHTARQIYSRTYDKQRKSWDLIRAPVDTLEFESYFRTGLSMDWNECDWNCCEPGESYARLTPKSFLIDNGEVFVAWDGFYKNCNEEEKNEEGLLWTIGISRLKSDHSCILNGGDDEQNFSKCTETVSILYQNQGGRNRALPYGGFSFARIPSSEQRIFFLSALHSDGVDQGKLYSEVWVFPEGAHSRDVTQELQMFGALEIQASFFDEEIEDAGSLRLHFDKNGQLNHLCRTVFDQGVACLPIQLDFGGRVSVGHDVFFVDATQVQETCYVKLSQNKAYYNRASTVVTGLEVLWDSVGDPALVFFGCIGTDGGHGNFTTADRNGKISTTLLGAYPGSILFGTTMPEALSPPSGGRSDFGESVAWSFLSRKLPWITLIGLFCSYIVSFLLVSGSSRVVVRARTLVGRSGGPDAMDEETLCSSPCPTTLETETSYLELSSCALPLIPK